MRDWSDGRIDGTYSVSCYQSALRKLPEDLRVYSSAPDDIERALQQKLTGSAARSSRGLAVAGKHRAARTSVETAAKSSSFDRPTVLAAALGTFGLALAVVGGLARRRRSR